MVKFRPLVVNFLLFGLFAVAIITGLIVMANQNNPSQSIGNDPSLSGYSTSVTGALNDSYTNAAGESAAFGNSTVSNTGTLPYSPAVGGIWKTMKNAPVTIWNLTVGLATGYLLGPDMAAVLWGTLGAILLITIISVVYYWIVRGEAG